MFSIWVLSLIDLIIISVSVLLKTVTNMGKQVDFSKHFSIFYLM